MGCGWTTCQEASSPVYVNPAASQPVPAETNFATLSKPAPLSLTKSSYVTFQRANAALEGVVAHAVHLREFGLEVG